MPPLLGLLNIPNCYPELTLWATDISPLSGLATLMPQSVLLVLVILSFQSLIGASLSSSFQSS
jgi:hypothetical protein